MNEDYLEGIAACIAGEECPEDASEGFIAGYSFEYSFQQTMSKDDG